MNNSALLDTIECAGVTLRLVGGKLKATGSESAIARIKPYIAQNRDEIIRDLEPDYYPTREDIDLLDSLINELCDQRGDSLETRQAMLAARRKMRPVLIPENIAALRLWITDGIPTERHANG